MAATSKVGHKRPDPLDPFLADLLAPLGDVRARRMFGGVGIYRGDVMFALIAADELYFKADETTIPDFETEGCGPFVYSGKGKPIRMSYWKVPERLFDEPDAFLEFAGKAVLIAEKTAERRAGRKD